MTCPFCGKADNPAHAKFCSHCGTALLPPQAAQPGQHIHPEEPVQASRAGQASGTADWPGRSRHGFYAGQVSHLDQVGPAHGAHHIHAPVHSERTDEVRQGGDVAPPPIHSTSRHFDERYGTGGRFVSQRPDPPVPADAPPPPAPEPVQPPAITPAMVFGFGQKGPAPADAPPPVEPRSLPPLTAAGAQEPDPVSRTFGTWENPPAPTSRPDFVVAAEQAQAERAGDAVSYPTTPVDLTTVRDLFPEPRLDAAIQPATPNEPVTSAPQGDQPAHPAEEARRGADLGSTRMVGAPEVAPAVAAATATGPQAAVVGADAEPAARPDDEGDRHAQDRGQAANRFEQAGSPGHAGSGHGGGPARPVGPANASDGSTGAEPDVIAPPTKQSRYWATGAHASAFVGAWMGGVPAFVGPLVVWLARKDNDPFAAEHGRNALNFNLSVIVYVLGLIIFSIITFGIGLLVTIPGFIALGLAWFAFTLVGTIKAASSETYKYPLTIKFVR